jgi:DNA-binding NarL/FixJ family response regulator
MNGQETPRQASRGNDACDEQDVATACNRNETNSSGVSLMSKLRVLLVDDHAVVREALSLLIKGQADMEVVAEASAGREALRLANEKQPDVVVLDISLPDMSGAETAQQINRLCPSTRILALTRHADQGYVRRLLQAGAVGYVLKKSAADTLLTAIRIVAQGGTYIEPSLAGPLLKRTFSVPPPAQRTGNNDALSAREEEVLQAIAWGRSNKEIAMALSLSIKTVESYKAAALEKLRLSTRADIVRYAVSRGWLTSDRAPE